MSWSNCCISTKICISTTGYVWGAWDDRKYKCICIYVSWWRHQMKPFSALLALCAGTSPGTGEFPAQRPVTRSFGVFFVLRLNKRLSKQSWGWWFETPSRSIWCHCNLERRLYSIIQDLICHHRSLTWCGHVWSCNIISTGQVMYAVIKYCQAQSDRTAVSLVNTLRRRQNGRHFADDRFKCIFL